MLPIASKSDTEILLHGRRCPEKVTTSHTPAFFTPAVLLADLRDQPDNLIPNGRAKEGIAGHGGTLCVMTSPSLKEAG